MNGAPDAHEPALLEAPSDDLPPVQRRQAAHALVAELRRRREAAEQRRADAEAALANLAHAARRLRRIGRTDDLLRLATDEAATVSRFECVVLSTVEGDRWTVRVRRVPGVEVDATADPTPLRAGSPEAAAVGSGTPVVVASTSTDADEQMAPPALDVPYAVVPLVSAGTVIGLLHGCHDDRRAIGDPELAAFTAFAGMLGALWYGTALESAWATRVQDVHREMAERLEQLLDEPIDDPDPFGVLTAPASDGAAPPEPPAGRGSAQPLTPRERVVLKHVLDGASNREIAAELVLTIDTVKSHVKRILRKLGASNRAELIHRGGRRAPS